MSIKQRKKSARLCVVHLNVPKD